MESKFSDAVKHVISNARLECLSLGYTYITPEMFILGMLRDEDGKPPIKESGALKTMRNLGVDLNRLICVLEEQISLGCAKSTEVPLGNVPLSKAAETAIKLSNQQAIRLGKNKTVDTIHLLAAILEGLTEPESNGLLKKTGLSLSKVTEEFYFDDWGDLTEKEIERQIKKSKERILELKRKSMVLREPQEIDLVPVTVAPLSLFFNMGEFDREEIKDIMALLSEIYYEQSGDQLVIKGMNQFEVVQHLACV